MRSPTPILMAALAVLGAVGCGSSPRSSAGRPTATTGPTTPAVSTPGATAPVCAHAAAPAPKGAQHLNAPTQRLDPHKTFTARMVTSCGEIDIQLDVRRAPRTSASFAYLARRGFYNSLTFHRIVPGFVIQGGDPQGDGQGGPGYSVVERPSAGIAYTRGVVAMAKTQSDPAGASGSQFYIVTGSDANLPPDYALLGRVTRGDAVLSAIEAVPNSGAPDNRPLSPVVIERVTISAAG